MSSAKMPRIPEDHRAKLPKRIQNGVLFPCNLGNLDKNPPKDETLLIGLPVKLYRCCIRNSIQH